MDGGCQLHKDIKKQSNVVLGQVDFINCLPINLPIELGEVKVDATIVNGVPSELNKKILSGEIDIAPVSSLTYIQNKDKLIPIGDLCISSNGPSDSVLLFSKFPIEELDGAKIALSPASATSNKLLEILFKEFLNLKATFAISSKGGVTPSLQSDDYAARLFIGDHALSEFAKMPRDVFIYDLGSLWKKHTGLPMVFGIWVVRKEILNTGQDLPLIVNNLKQAKEIGLGSMFDKVVKKAQEKVLISKDFYNTYFQHLSYEFNDECKKGLEVFESYTESGKIQSLIA